MLSVSFIDPQMYKCNKRLQELYAIADEYFINKIKDRVIDEVRRQSKFITRHPLRLALPHGFDILETGEMLQLEDVKKDCLNFFVGKLKCYQDTKDFLLTGRTISIETQLRVKGILLEELIKCGSKDDMLKLAKELSTFDISKQTCVPH